MLPHDLFFKFLFYLYLFVLSCSGYTSDLEDIMEFIKNNENRMPNHIKVTCVGDNEFDINISFCDGVEKKSNIKFYSKCLHNVCYKEIDGLRIQDIFKFHKYLSELRNKCNKDNIDSIINGLESGVGTFSLVDLYDIFHEINIMRDFYHNALNEEKKEWIKTAPVAEIIQQRWVLELAKRAKEQNCKNYELISMQKAIDIMNIKFSFRLKKLIEVKDCLTLSDLQKHNNLYTFVTN